MDRPSLGAQKNNTTVRAIDNAGLTHVYQNSVWTVEPQLRLDVSVNLSLDIFLMSLLYVFMVCVFRYPLREAVIWFVMLEMFDFTFRHFSPMLVVKEGQQ